MMSTAGVALKPIELFLRSLVGLVKRGNIWVFHGSLNSIICCANRNTFQWKVIPVALYNHYFLCTHQTGVR